MTPFDPFASSLQPLTFNVLGLSPSERKIPVKDRSALTTERGMVILRAKIYPHEARIVEESLTEFSGREAYGAEK
jgi:hypothetical protein